MRPTCQTSSFKKIFWLNHNEMTSRLIIWQADQIQQGPDQLPTFKCSRKPPKTFIIHFDIRWQTTDGAGMLMRSLAEIVWQVHRQRDKVNHRPGGSEAFNCSKKDMSSLTRQALLCLPAWMIVRCSCFDMLIPLWKHCLLSTQWRDCVIWRILYFQGEANCYNFFFSAGMYRAESTSNSDYTMRGLVGFEWITQKNYQDFTRFRMSLCIKRIIFLC